MKILTKYYLAVIYEVVLMLALTLTLTAIFYMLFGDASHGWKRICLQWVLWVSMGGYFVRCWVITGQTLASQTWHLKVVAADGNLLTLKQAMIRYLLASLFILPAGLTLWWAIIDVDRLPLHDRLLGSRFKQV